MQLRCAIDDLHDLVPVRMPLQAILPANYVRVRPVSIVMPALGPCLRSVGQLPAGNSFPLPRDTLHGPATNPNDAGDLEYTVTSGQFVTNALLDLGLDAGASDRLAALGSL